MSHRSRHLLLIASLKTTLVERITNESNVPGDGAVFAWAQVVVDLFSRNPPLDSIFASACSLMPSSLAAAGVGFHGIGIQGRSLNRIGLTRLTFERPSDTQDSEILLEEFVPRRDINLA